MKFFIFSIAIILCASELVSARGTEGVGGGDSCEARIKDIGADLNSWIKNGGYLFLKLPSEISYSAYADIMSKKITNAKVACVSKGDNYYPVEINGTPKICKFYRQEGADLITCDADKFRSLTEDEQYILTHHEYAGLAEFEKPTADVSDYSISKQISAFLELQTVKKLAVKSTPSALESYAEKAGNIPAGSSIKMGIDFVTKANSDKTLLGRERIRTNCSSVGENQVCDFNYIDCWLTYPNKPTAYKIKQGTKFYITSINTGWIATGPYQSAYTRTFMIDRRPDGEGELALYCQSLKSDYLTKDLNNLLKKSLNSEIILEEPQDF